MTKIDIENANITGDTVSITAKATQNKNYNLASTDDLTFIGDTILGVFKGDAPSLSSLWGVAGKAEAEVNVKESIVTALKFLHFGIKSFRSSQQLKSFYNGT